MSQKHTKILLLTQYSKNIYINKQKEKLKGFYDLDGWIFEITQIKEKTDQEKSLLNSHSENPDQICSRRQLKIWAHWLKFELPSRPQLICNGNQSQKQGMLGRREVEKFPRNVKGIRKGAKLKSAN